MPVAVPAITGSLALLKFLPDFRWPSYPLGRHLAFWVGLLVVVEQVWGDLVPGNPWAVVEVGGAILTPYPGSRASYFHYSPGAHEISSGLHGLEARGPLHFVKFSPFSGY